jgi:glutathione synthase/RimK-type ligase-like ATP-grasp enzyme
MLINLPLSIIIIMIIFINVNPYKKDENKLSILNYIPKKYTAKADKLTNIDLSKVNYPFIVKPTVCTRGGKGIVVIRNNNELQNYISNNKKYLDEILYQEFIPYMNEVGILYERDIFSNNGKIVSITKKKSSNSDIMTSCYGDVSCEDLSNLITPELNKIICEISDSIPNFNVGRYDIKYKDEKSLFNGKDFYILEANGTMGFDLRKNTTNILYSNYYLNRWFIYRLMYGIKNIISFNGYSFLDNIYMLQNSVNKFIQCNDWEKLFSRYT